MAALEGEGALLRMLAETSRALSERRDAKAAMNIVARAGADSIGDACLVQILSDSGRELQLLALSHRDPEAERHLRRELSRTPLSWQGLPSEVLRTDRPACRDVVDPSPPSSGQAAEAAPARSYLERFPVRAMMAVPLHVQGRPIGVVSTTRHRPDAAYTATDLALLEVLAERGETAIATAQDLDRAVEERRRLETVLAEAERARDALEAEVVEQRRAEVRQRCLTEATIVLASSLEQQTPEALLEKVAGVVVDDIADGCAIELGPDPEARFPGARANAGAVQPPQESMVVTPIHTQRRVIGTLTLVRESVERSFDTADVHFTQELARRIGICIHNAELYRAAREAVGLRDEFLSIASHELKTPLTSLQLQLQSLHASARRAPVPQQHLCDRLSRAERQVSRVETLIAELLDASRLLSGRFPMRPVRLDLAEVTRDVVTRLEELAEHGACPIRLSLRPTIGHWDREGLEQVIENLVVNAIKYGEGEPIEVKVDGDGPRAILEVADGGIGIGSDDQERIFGRFERAVSTRNYGGLGIGLWLVRELVEKHRGKVTVSSEPGRGATFRVQLPRSCVGVDDA